MVNSDICVQRLKLLLEQNNCSPEELSKSTEIPLTTIRQYLRGARDTISTRNLFFIAKHFNMSMADLIDFLSESQKPSK